MITAYRSWKVSTKFELVGSWRHEPWAKEVSATCIHHEGEVPKEDCQCGYYAYKKPTLHGRHEYSVAILGVVLLHGKIVEHEIGFRAEKAIIETLFYPYYILNRIYPTEFSNVFVQGDTGITTEELVERVSQRYNMPISTERIKFDIGDGFN